MKKKKLMNGVLFAVPLPDGRFISGRVMLDIAANIKRRLFPWDSPLGNMFSVTVLVEMYSAITPKPEYVPSPVLVPARFVVPKEIGKAWPILGEIPVDPRSVEFPESVYGLQGGTGFFYGEIEIPIPLTGKQCDEINVRGGFDWVAGFPYTCESLLGISKRYHWTPQEELAHNDLRFSKHRVRIYEHLPFPMELSYYEKQKIMGLHLERLYE